MVDIIFVFSEILVLCAYLFRKMLSLRLMSITASSGYIIGALIAGLHSPGMKAVILFSSLTISINVIQIARLQLDKIPILLPDELKDLYRNIFSMMTPKQFHRFYNLACLKSYNKNSVLLKQGEPVSNLMLIKSGSVNVLKDNYKVATLDEGYFIGEMSFLTHEGARGTVQAADNLECIVWNQEQLKNLENRDPELSSKLKQVIVLNLIKKIDQKNESVK